MVSALDSGSRGPGSSPGGSLCCGLGQDTWNPDEMLGVTSDGLSSYPGG